MKRLTKLTLLLVLMLLTSIAAAACGSGTVTVTYRCGDQTVTQQAVKGAKLLAPALTKDGYVLDGWYTDEALSQVFDFGTQTVDGDLTLYATWQKGTYTVRFEDAGEIPDQTIAPGGHAVSPAVTPAAGLELEGWYTDEDKTQAYDFSAAVQSDLTLYAKFAPKNFRIVYDNGFSGGTAPTQDEVAYNGEFTVAQAPARIGYQFLGWTDGENTYQAGDIYTVTGENDIVLVGCWSTARYSVNFYDDTGAKIATARVPHGGAAAAPAADRVTSSRWAYAHTGWDRDFSQVTEDMDVHAVYTYRPAAISNFDFTLNEDGSSYSIALKTGVTLEEIALPAEFDGKPVTDIAHNGFQECEATRIYIPSSYRTIGYEAFYRSMVEEVTIEEGLTYIDHCAFQNSQLSEINFPSTLESIGYYIFNRAYNFVEPVLASENTYLTYEGGKLFTSDRTKLLFVSPQTLDLVIPATVTDVWAGICADYNLLESVVIEGHVKELSAGAFYNCSSLTELTINGSVARIGGEGDLPLGYESECEIPDKGAFFSCNLSRIRLPGIQYLGSAAFNWNWGITELYLDKTIEFLGDAFVDNSNLTLTKVEMMGATENDHYIIENNTVIEKGTGLNGGNTFMIYLASNPMTEYAVPDGVTAIRPFAFQGTVNLVTVTVPEGVEEIMTGTFMATNSSFNEETMESVLLTSLTTVHLPSSLKRITSEIDIWGGVEQWGSVRGAFLSCQKLSTVTFGENSQLEYIGANAFADTAITSFSIPATCTEIGISALTSTALTEVTVASENPNYTSKDGVLYDKDMTTLILYPAAKEGTSFTVPDTVVSIGDFAFVTNQYLQQVLFPNSLQSIGTSAFIQAKELSELAFNEGLIRIGENAFSGCSKLERIVFPASLEEVLSDAFVLLPNLTYVEFQSDVPPLFYLMSYPPFTNAVMDPNTYQETISVNESLVIKIPADAFLAYYEQFLGYGLGLCDRLEADGLTETQFTFESNGGSQIAPVTGYAVSTMPIPTHEDSSLYFQGWYTKDGTAGDWGERVSFPYICPGQAQVTLFARWETERYKDGSSFLFAYDMTTAPVEYTMENNYQYFIFRAPISGRAYLRWDLEGLFLGYSAWTVPDENDMENWVPRVFGDNDESYWMFEAGKTYYIRLMNFSVNDESVDQITSSFWIEMIYDSGSSPLPQSASVNALPAAALPEPKRSEE